MNELCHYTSIDSLLKIVLPDGIDLIATFFKHHGKDDYDWIRERGKRIIKELCEEHCWNYDPYCLAYNPYIISFCTNSNSYHMWNEFDGKGTEAMLSFNPYLFWHSISITKLESLVPCKYVDCNATDDEIKKTVLDILENEYFENLENEDLLKLAIMGVMQSKFHEEEELRYIKLCHLYATVSPTVDGPLVSIYEVPKKDYHIHIQFPKGIINSIYLRNDVSEDDYKDVVNHMVRCGYSSDIVSKKI